MPDELGVIRSIVGRAGELPKGFSKIGDDVAAVPQGSGKIVLKVDMLVQHTDVPRAMSYRQAARKAVAMCVSDFAAKGVRPYAFMVSLGLVRGVGKKEVDGLALGLKDAEKEWGVLLVGGDTNEAQELVIDCAMVGFAERLVPRSGARPGQVLVVTGKFGLPPAGLRLLSGQASAASVFGQKAKSSVLSPRPDLKVGLALAPFLSASMDSSDGLARSLHILAAESRVGFEVTCSPAARGVQSFAEANGVSAEELVFEGGEEYAIVGTLPRARVSAAKAAARRAGGELLEIGRVTRERRVVRATGGGVRPIRDRGWTHLR